MWVGGEVVCLCQGQTFQKYLLLQVSQSKFNKFRSNFDIYWHFLPIFNQIWHLSGQDWWYQDGMDCCLAQVFVLSTLLFAIKQSSTIFSNKFQYLLVAKPNSTQSWVSLIFLCKPQTTPKPSITFSQLLHNPTRPKSVCNLISTELEDSWGEKMGRLHTQL